MVSVLNAHVAKLKLAGMATSGLVMVGKKIPSPKMRVDLCILKRLTKNTYFLGGTCKLLFDVYSLLSG